MKKYKRIVSSILSFALFVTTILGTLGLPEMATPVYADEEEKVGYHWTDYDGYVDYPIIKMPTLGETVSEEEANRRNNSSDGAGVGYKEFWEAHKNVTVIGDGCCEDNCSCCNKGLITLHHSSRRMYGEMYGYINYKGEQIITGVINPYWEEQGEGCTCGGGCSDPLYLSYNDEGVKYSATDNPKTSGTIKEYYKGRLQVPNNYTLTFNPQNGKDATSYTVTYGSNSYNNVACDTPTANNYKFLGWATSNQSAEDMINGTIKGTLIYNANGSCIKGTSYWNNDGNFCNASQNNGGTYTLYGQWKLNGSTLTYDGNGATNGSMNPSSVTINYGSTWTVPECGYTRDGYTFSGWWHIYKDGAYKFEAKPNDTFTVGEGNLSEIGSYMIYPIWQGVETQLNISASCDNNDCTNTGYTYKLYINDNEVTKTNNNLYTVHYGDRYKINTISMDGHTSNNTEYAGTITSLTNASTNVTLTFNATQYSVTKKVYYQNADGSYTCQSSSTNTLKYGTNVSVDTPTNYNYNKEKSENHDQSVKVTGNQTINFYFDRNTFTVTTTNGDYINSISGGGTYRWGQTVSIIATPNTKTAKYTYSFNNWTVPNGITLANSNSASTSFTMPTSNVTVKANGTQTINKYNQEINVYYQKPDGTYYNATNEVNSSVDYDNTLEWKYTANGYNADYSPSVYYPYSYVINNQSETLFNGADTFTYTVSNTTSPVTVYIKRHLLNMEYNLNGGYADGWNNGIYIQQYLVGADIDLSYSGKRDGWKFVGWSTTQDVSGSNYPTSSLLTSYQMPVKPQNGNTHYLYAQWQDMTAPIVTVDKENTNNKWEKSIDIRVNVTDAQGTLYNGAHTYSDGNITSYEYCWSTDMTTPNGEWKTYTPNTDSAIIGSGMTGTYYLFIKRVGDVERFNHYNWSTNSLYHIYGPYYFDNTAPNSSDIRYNYPDSTVDEINWYEEDTILQFTIKDNNAGIKSIILCNIDDVPLVTNTYNDDRTVTAAVERDIIFKDYIFNTEGANLYKLIVTDNLDNENIYTFMVKVSKNTIVDEQHYAVWKGTSNLDVYANWTPNTYTIEYDYNKPIKDNKVPNESNAVVQYKYGDKKDLSKYLVDATEDIKNNTTKSKDIIFDNKIGTMPIPTLNGWIFTGWYINGVRIDENTTYSSYQNETAVAGWKSDTYTITFDYNKPDIASTEITGNDITSKQVKFNETYGELPNPSMDGWTFIGWWTDPDEGEKVTQDTQYVIVGNSTIYAHWVQNTYTVTFDYNYPKTTSDNPGSSYIFGSFGVDSAVAQIKGDMKGTSSKFPATATKTLLNNVTTIKTLIFDNKIGILPKPTLEGWTFDGWYINNIKVDENTIYSIYQDTKITARWVQNIYEVRLYPDTPSNASNQVEHKQDYKSWNWNGNGYYTKKFGYDDSYIIPTVDELYTLTGWTSLDDNNERNNEGGYWYYNQTIYGNAESDAYPIQYDKTNIGTVKKTKKWNFNSKNNSVQNLYVHWDANVYTITLDDYDATSNAQYKELYEKYDTGIFTNINCKKIAYITNIGILPEKLNSYDELSHNYHYSGYYTNTLERDIQFIDEQGNILWNNKLQFLKDTIIYASWYYHVIYNNNITNYQDRTSITGIMSASRYLYARSDDYKDNISYLSTNKYIFTDSRWDFDKWCTWSNPLKDNNNKAIYFDNGQEILNLGDTTLYLIASYTDMYAKQNVIDIDNITGEVTLKSETIKPGNSTDKWTNAIEFYTEDIALSKYITDRWSFNTISQNVIYLPTNENINAGLKYLPKHVTTKLTTIVKNINNKLVVTGKTDGSGYNRDIKTTAIQYNIQGRYGVTNDTTFEKIRQVTMSNKLKYPTTTIINNNTAGTIKFKLDRTKPIISNLIVSNETLDKRNPDGEYKYKIEDLNNEIMNNSSLGTSTITVNVSDYNDTINGEYKDRNDSSGIQAVYIKIIGENTGTIIYDKLDLISNGIKNAEDSAYISGTYSKTFNFMLMFPNDANVKAEIYAIDNAGNTSDYVKNITDLKFNTFSIRVVAYSDEDACFNQNINTGDVYFKTGDYGHIEIWTIGYVESVSLDFLSLGNEAVKEIASGNLLPIYNLGSTENGSLYTREVSYTIGQQITVNTGIVNNNAKGIPYAIHYNYLSSYDSITKDPITQNLVYNNRKWLNEGLSMRIPPYYKLKENKELLNSDGTPSYYPEIHEFIATAHKDNALCNSTAKFVIWDTRSSDIHYRLYH